MASNEFREDSDILANASDTSVAMVVSLGNNPEAISRPTPSMAVCMSVMASSNAAASAAISVLITPPNSRAFAMSASIPPWPSFNSGNSAGPADRPNIPAAIAAFSVSLSTIFNASATSSITDVPLRSCPLASVTSTPRRSNESFASPTPCAVSFMFRAKRRMPVSTVSIDVPDRSAANFNADKSSTVSPVRRLILWNASPVAAARLMMAPNPATIPADATLILRPTDRNV